MTACLIFKNLEEVKCVGPRGAWARVLDAAGKNEAPDMGCDCIERTPLLTSGGVRSQAKDYDRDSGAELELKVIGSSE